MNAPHRSDAIRLAQQRISELENEINRLQKEAWLERDQQFLEDLGKLMQTYQVNADEVVELLMLRGDIDQKSFACESIYHLRHIFSIAEIQVAKGADQPSWLRKG
ncbi:hypothetical protein [Pseudomonas sp. EL_65y_Pfl2_R96]|uniref:hypothetical protein n=1 Tax=Pseudomonas sp. EL_65y_Pfl2_R96 TaxID=3088699 RepID=UPI0030D74AD2